MNRDDRDDSDSRSTSTSITRVKDFYVVIESDGRTVRPRRTDGFTYYPIQHKATYRVRLGNDSDRRADVDLFIDNEKMGTWRVPAYSSILVERPVKSARLFTFLRERSITATLAGVEPKNPNNGLIRAVFKKERRSAWSTPSTRGIQSRSCFFGSDDNESDCRGSRQSREVTMNFMHQILRTDTNNQIENQNCMLDSDGGSLASLVSGATVLGDNSDQEFHTVSQIRDYESPVTVNVRLVTWKPNRLVTWKPNRLVTWKPDRFTRHSNPVPPPIRPFRSRHTPSPFWDPFTARAALY